MKHFILIALLLAVPGFAEHEKVTSMTEQEAQSLRTADGEPRTYTLSPEKKEYSLGLKKPLERSKKKKPSRKFLTADLKVPANFHIAKDFGIQLTGIYNQGNCGSCVYNSLGKNAADFLLLNGAKSPVLSRQHIMDCLQRQWMCSGSFGEYVAKGIVNSKGVHAEKDYPYTARDGSCKDLPGDLTKGWTGYKLIDNSPKSIAGALLSRHPVSVTVAADNAWSGYNGGIYNGCGSNSTNHEVLIYGWSCESSVDTEGNCVFDAKGYPVNGDGYAIVVNSWGDWGVSGEMKSRWRGRSGQLCNALAEEALILEGQVTPPTPPKPVDGGWSAWSAWSTCHNDASYRSRTCTNPVPLNGGKPCEGGTLDIKACKTTCNGFLCGLICWPWCSKEAVTPTDAE